MSGNLKEIGLLFFKLGWIAFGGPAAHIGFVEAEVVEKRKWISREKFLDIIGATNLIPGPNSTELVMHCGLTRGGIPGLFVAGIAFIFPSALLTGILAWFYTKYGALPEVSPFIQGIKPAVLVIIISAIYKLGKKAAKSTELIIFGVVAIGLCFLGFSEISALLITGIVGAFYFLFKAKWIGPKLTSFLPLGFLLQVSPTIQSIPLIKVFLSFLKVGAILYGSGYVLFAYLDAELVARGWLSQSELIDAIAVGQFTPGPVLTTATFVGYRLAGLWGAVVATVGIFLPSFFFVMILKRILPKMRASKFFSYFLDCVNIAAVAVMVYILWKMGIEVLFDWKMGLIFALSLLYFFGIKKPSSVLVVLGGAVLGYLLSLM